MIIKNKKGLTLVELLICIALISSLMLGMYELLSSVNSKKKSATELGNLIMKSGEITINLENLIKDKEINKIDFDNENNNINYYSTISSEFPAATLKFDNKSNKSSTITVTSSDNENRKWIFDNTKVSVCIKKNEGDDTHAINLVLLLKNSVTDEVKYTIEFPYYSSNIITINGNINQCGE